MQGDKKKMTEREREAGGGEKKGSLASLTRFYSEQSSSVNPTVNIVRSTKKTQSLPLDHITRLNKLMAQSLSMAHRPKLSWFPHFLSNYQSSITAFYSGAFCTHHWNVCVLSVNRCVC